jgi:O-antigen/teichoic acid export membrane protein
MRDRITDLFRKDGVSGPALMLVAGRTVGFIAAFAIPVVLARRFDRAAFGTYKQLFLVYATLFGLAQVGAAESLYYFVPRNRDEAGRRVANAIVTLAAMGAVCLAGLYVGRNAIAQWLSNAAVAEYLPLVGVFLAFTLLSAALEIVMVSRKEHTIATFTYAGSDLLRTALFVLPALAVGSLRGVLVGAAAFAAVRVVAMLGYFHREFGCSLRVDIGLWRDQLAYALPFALAVGIDVVQANFHQWAVATRFDAATFAIYAVGCLQIPLVDLVCTSTGNVMMVKMAELAGDGRREGLALWHETTARLASMMFPLAAVLLLTAHRVIVFLFTHRYAASVPVFMVWCLLILPSAFAVDSVLRAYAQTRFLLVMNVVRLAMIAVLIGWFLGHLGLIGAVLVTLVATSVVKAAALVRIARLMNVGLTDVLPWKRLGVIAVHSAVAAIPAWAIARVVIVPPLAATVLTGAIYAAAFLAIWYLRATFVGADPRVRPGSTHGSTPTRLFEAAAQSDTSL